MDLLQKELLRRLKKNMIKSIFLIFIFFFFINKSHANENIMILKLKYGDVVIELFNEIAPNHVKRFKQ